MRCVGKYPFGLGQTDQKEKEQMRLFVPKIHGNLREEIGRLSKAENPGIAWYHLEDRPDRRQSEWSPSGFGFLRSQ